MHEPVSPAPLAPADLAAFLDAARPHAIRLVAGLTIAALQDHLALAPPSRPVLALDLGTAATTEGCVSAALDQVARAVAGLWPYLWGGQDFSDLRDDALGHAHLPIRLAALGARLPSVAQAWAVQAIRRLLHGQSPRVPGVAQTLGWPQLVQAFDPGGLLLAVTLPLDRSAAPARIAALEWLARQAPVAVLVLTETWPADPAFDRILYGARRILPAFADPTDTNDAIRAERERPIIVLPPAPEGRPHPLSPLEQKLFKLIQADDELRPLFAFNKTIPDLPLLAARPDLLWLAGRVAVEIDGPEHRAPAKFRADRRRDYELMCAGYRVLRMTNEDVETDAALAIEKIRRVARLAGTETG